MDYVFITIALSDIRKKKDEIGPKAKDLREKNL
jgi:hypothetical protein